MSENETPTETETTETVKQERGSDGKFLPKPKTEPLYSKREPQSSDRIDSISSTMTEYRDLLTNQLPEGTTLPEEFEKESIRSQIKILKYMVKANTSKPNTDAPTEHPLDKTGKAKIGGEVPAPTTVHTPSLLEKNRADQFIREARAKTGFGQYRDKWKQTTDKK